VKIDAAQMQAIAGQRDAAYARATVSWYRVNWPMIARGVSDEAFAQRVLAALRRARELGLGRPQDATAYVSLALQAGPAFVDDPSVLRFLSYPGREPADQLRRLVRDVGERIGRAGRRRATAG